MRELEYLWRCVKSDKQSWWKRFSGFPGFTKDQSSLFFATFWKDVKYLPGNAKPLSKNVNECTAQCKQLKQLKQLYWEIPGIRLWSSTNYFVLPLFIELYCVTNELFIELEQINKFHLKLFWIVAFNINKANFPIIQNCKNVVCIGQWTEPNESSES